jgi:hypothetical protein
MLSGYLNVTNHDQGSLIVSYATQGLSKSETFKIFVDGFEVFSTGSGRQEF